MSPESAAWESRFHAYIARLPAADPGHDVRHVLRVVNLAKKLALAEQADMHVVLPAAWLHDCFPVSKDSPLRSSASRLSAERAVKLLSEWGYDLADHAAIAHAIEAHSFSAGVPAETLEAKIVQDADRMDSLGAIGVARVVMVGAQLQRQLYNEDDPFCRRRNPDDGVSTLDHFYTKLLNLKDNFHTEAARHEASKRHDFMLDFLQQLQHETGED